MDSTVVKETENIVITEELDRLGKKVDLVTQLIVDLKQERLELRQECERLRKERQRVLDTAEVPDSAALLRTLDQVRTIRDENRLLLQERGEVCSRLELLMEKVDLLLRDS